MPALMAPTAFDRPTARAPVSVAHRSAKAASSKPGSGSETAASRHIKRIAMKMFWVSLAL
jgi:hypothetical protein